MYALAPEGVERLESRRRHGSRRLGWRGPRLKWRGPDASGMELAHVVLLHVARQMPSAYVTALFATDVLRKLPKHGFAIAGPQIEEWIRRMTLARDWTPLDAESGAKP